MFILCIYIMYIYIYICMYTYIYIYIYTYNTSYGVIFTTSLTSGSPLPRSARCAPDVFREFPRGGLVKGV